MTNQIKTGGNDKVIKNSSNTEKKLISFKTIFVSLLVLIAAFGIGIAIREFRLRSDRERLSTLNSEAVQLSNTIEPNRSPKQPEFQNKQEQIPIKEVVVIPEPVAPMPLPTVDISNQNNTGAQMDKTQVPQYQDPRFNDPVFKEQLGRYALSFVGYDPVANQIWAALINDPDLSGQVRKDLIEDLNENGFSGGNGRTATVDDLPLILYRIQLIETFAPSAMDEVNSDAFQEVHKDLMNMATRLSQ
jgi:hypothetical protein